MQVINSLMNKCGLASIEISKMFLELEVGSRIPTVTEISKNFSLPRGTVQNAIKNLTDLGAIKLQAKGYKGTTLTEKNTKILLEIIGVTDLAGIMPFPYSKRHEGLASGLTKTLENSEIPVYIAYMRGAVKRMRMVEQGRYDFAIVSKLSAERYLKDHDDLQILYNFGEYSYLSKHVICFSDEKATQIENGMRVGLDEVSADTYDITIRLCDGKKVTFVPMEYYQSVEKVIKGELDAVVTNVDEIKDKGMPACYVDIDDLCDGYDNEAVLVTLKDSLIPDSYLSALIDKEVVLETQKLVLEKKLRLL